MQSSYNQGVTQTAYYDNANLDDAEEEIVDGEVDGMFIAGGKILKCRQQ